VYPGSGTLILHYNVGITAAIATSNLPLGAWDRVFSFQYDQLLTDPTEEMAVMTLAMRAALPFMRSQRSGGSAVCR
jgi:NAD(P)-dependent dehydrogenase (short-subunit alcohol dehydrogenase family)